MNIIYLNCGERYEDIVDQRSYVHNLSSCESIGKIAQPHSTFERNNTWSQNTHERTVGLFHANPRFFLGRHVSSTRSVLAQIPTVNLKNIQTMILRNKLITCRRTRATLHYKMQMYSTYLMRTILLNSRFLPPPPHVRDFSARRICFGYQSGKVAGFPDCLSL